MSGPSRIEVTNNAARRRYELRLSGNLAGYAAYELENDRVLFVHTRIARALRGAGLGRTLAEAALDDVRAHRRHAAARCEFISDYLFRHPKYADPLAAEGPRALPPAA
jgi:uncharacterized protein